jgi:hypothetical protein
MIPLPSFFKIRLLALVAAFLFLFLFVGFSKWCLASSIEILNITADPIAFNPTINTNTTATFDMCTGVLGSTGDIGKTSEGISLTVYFNMWNGDVFIGSYNSNSNYHATNGTELIYLNAGVCPPYVPPLSDCDLARAAIEATCEYGLHHYDCETGDWACNGKPCSAYQDECFSSQAENTVCEFTSQGEDEFGECINPECNCYPLTCPEKRALCEQACGGASNVAVNTCLEQDGVIVASDCQCFAPDDTTYTPPDPYDPNIPGDPDLPDPDDTDNSPDPSDETGTPDESSDTDTDTDLQKKIVDNTAKILKSLDRELNELNTEADRIRTTLDSIDTSLTDALDGDYTEEVIIQDFDTTSLGQDFSPFSDRVDSFFNALQNTDLFGLTDDIIFDIPTGGTSTLTLDLGSYGSVDLDFASWATQLRILRYVFLTCFSFAAIRIVVSKK